MNGSFSNKGILAFGEFIDTIEDTSTFTNSNSGGSGMSCVFNPFSNQGTITIDDFVTYGIVISGTGGIGTYSIDYPGTRSINGMRVSSIWGINCREFYHVLKIQMNASEKNGIPSKN